MALLLSILEASARRSVERGCTRPPLRAPAAGGLPLAAAMSLRSTRPPGPVPWTAARSMPCRAASLRATGEALTGWPWPGAVVPAVTGGPAGAASRPSRLGGSSAEVAVSSFPTRERSSSMPASPPSESGSSSSSTARVRPTWMISPSLTPKLTSVPSRGEGMSATTLSVSTTARVWPCFTRCPGRTFSSSTLPSASPSPMSGKANSKRFLGLIGQHPFGFRRSARSGSGSGARRGPAGRRRPARSGGRAAPGGARRPPPRPWP